MKVSFVLCHGTKDKPAGVVIIGYPYTGAINKGKMLGGISEFLSECIDELKDGEEMVFSLRREP